MKIYLKLVCSVTVLLVLVWNAREVQGHGKLTVPKSRNQLANERSWPDEVQYCPHCLNLGGRRTAPLVHPETVESARSFGLCGDAPSGPDSCWSGGDCPQQVRFTFSLSIRERERQRETQSRRFVSHDVLSVCV